MGAGHYHGYFTETKPGGYWLLADDGVHTKWGANQWFLAEQLSIFPRRMEGVRGELEGDWDVFTGNEASVGLLPQIQPPDKGKAGIRAHNRFSASYAARLSIVVGVYNTLIDRQAIPVDRPFP